jgi:diaminopimelate epimerase
MPIARIGDDFIVDTTTANDQINPTIAALADGRFVVTWYSDDGADYDIRARIFNADGTAAGDDFIVNNTMAGDQESSTVAALADGRFVVTWHSDNGTDYDIRARIFNADGSAAGNDFVVNSTTTNDQFFPTATALADGRFVLTWESNNGTDFDIRGRVFNADGSAAGDDFLVNDTTASDQYAPTVTTLADGRFVVTWDSSNGTDFDIRARIFNADGSVAGNDFLVNDTTVNSQLSPTITALADGRFVVTWHSDNGTDYDIRGRVFNADGSAAGDDFMVNSTVVKNQEYPAITALADGRFVVTWFSNDNGTDYDIYARIFNADGSRDSFDFIVNSTTVNFQYSPTVAALADGRFVVTWRSYDDGDGSGTNIRARIFDPTVFNGTDYTDWNGTWRGGAFADTISGGANNDQLYGLGGNDLIAGYGGNDYISGDDGDDYLSGGSGNDWLLDGSGVNVLDGGSGKDFAFVHLFSTEASLVHLADGDWQVSQGGTVDTLSNIEILAFSDRVKVLRQAPTSDFDESNTSDVLWRGTSGVLMVWEMSEGKRAGFTIMDGATATWSVAGVGDFNNDGTADILWRAGGTIMTWEIGDGAHTGSTVVGGAGSSWSIAGIGDFRGNGTSDILWRDASGTVAIWGINNGLQAGASVIANPGGTWDIAGVGDFNSDEISDILWRNADGTVATWEMAGTLLRTGGTAITSPGGTWSIAGIGDFNGDGTSDILWRNASGTVATWEMNDGLRTGTTSIANPGGTWSVAGVGDYNGDGTSDILWRNTNGTVAVWQMQNGRMFASTGISGPGGNWQIA